MEESGERIRVSLVAPALSMRLGLRALLSEDAGITVDSEAASFESLDPPPSPGSVLLLAGRAAAQDAVEVILNQRDVPFGLLLLQDEPLPAAQLSRLAAVPWGILSMESSAQELSAAARAVSAGLWVGDPTLLPDAIRAKANLAVSADDAEGESLTPREIDVLEQVALGLANKQIGQVLGMSENTVKFHISSIYMKLGASNRAEAVRIGARRGLISL